MFAHRMRSSAASRRFPKAIANIRGCTLHSVSRCVCSNWNGLSGYNAKLGSNDFNSQYQRIYFSTSSNKQLTERQKMFHERGWLDERGLTLFDTLYELTSRSCKVFAKNEAMGQYNPSIKGFEYVTYEEAGEMIEKTRHVLKRIGVEEYNKVGIISNNRWEWAAVAAASFSVNATVVPMYENQLGSDWSYIIDDSECSVVFCATQSIFDQVQKEIAPSAPNLKAILCFDAPEGESHSFHTLLAQVEDKIIGTEESQSLVTAPLPDDVANIIYTSGTTGKPKGVELTHRNITSNITGSARSMVKDPRDYIFESDRSLCVLPWSHSYGQTVELWMGWAHGGSTALSRGIPYIAEELQMVKPTVLMAVPLLYQRVYDGVQDYMANGSDTERTIIKRALRFGRKKAEADRGNGPPLGFIENIRYHLLDYFVLAKIRERLGGKLRTGGVGGAKCPLEVLEFMDALGIEIHEGYGLTETSPLMTGNSPEQKKVGTVGRPIGDVTVYIIGQDGKPVAQGEEGEICCVGPNVMKGYHNNKEETDKVISLAPDGKSRMFHSGDLGCLDEDGYLRVTGRIKEQYKLENGKYVVPTPIEDAISVSRFILQVIIYGDNRPYNVALIVPDWELIRKELSGDNSFDPDAASGEPLLEEVDQELANDKRVMAIINSELQNCCEKLRKYEVPKKWAFIDPSTHANAMLTPKMSIRRKKVLEKNEELLSQLYAT